MTTKSFQYYTRNYKPTLYCGLVTAVTLVSVTVFHFSNLVIVFETPKIYPLSKLSKSQWKINGEALDVSQKCLPKKNLFFLKVHKTASTTVQNIILRYATKHNLSIALPAKNTHLFPLDAPFKKEYVLESQPRSPNGHNILCHHLIYNREEVEKVVPSDSVFLSIIRNPTDLFESLYEYNNFKEKFKLTLSQFAELTRDKKAIAKLNRVTELPRNPLLHDFGATEDDILNVTKLVNLVKNISERFDLIMISEHFDESIILMKEKLCWQLEDVISFTNNARAPKYKTNLTQHTIELLNRWNNADNAFYSYFKKKFSDALSEQLERGIDIVGEVKLLQDKRRELYDACIDRKIPSNESKRYKFWTNKVLGYKLKVENKSCENMIKPEAEFTKEIRIEQLRSSKTF